MRIILIRHGERVRRGDLPDKDTPLSETGRGAAKKLRDALAGLGLKPQAYLTSAHLHAERPAICWLGEVLRGEEPATGASSVKILRQRLP
jgi:phosphohistidine phosphatase SixA